MIQTAVGFYHLSNNNFKGACSQFGKALTKLDQYLPACSGINTRDLVDNVNRCLVDAEYLRNGGEGGFDETKIPRIVWDSIK